MNLICLRINKIFQNENDLYVDAEILIIEVSVIFLAKFNFHPDGKTVEMDIRFHDDIQTGLINSSYKIACFIALEKMILSSDFNHPYKEELIELIKMRLYPSPWEFWSEFNLEQLEYVLENKKKELQEHS